MRYPRRRLISPVLALAVVVVAVSVVARPAPGADWPRFRGPTGCGTTEEKGLPIQWGGKDDENILWKTPLPKSHNPWSSPVLTGDRIFFTSAKMEGQEQHVLCFSKADGKPLWDTVIPPGPWKGAEPKGGLSGPTPVTDGKHVYVVFGSAVVVCLDLEGKVVWRKDLPECNFDVTVGASPILYEDTLVYIADQNKKTSSLLAYDKATGEVRWEQKRPDVIFAHSTPILIMVGGRVQLIVSASGALQGFDPAKGEMLWWCKGNGETASPVYGEGLVYVDNGRGGGGMAVDPTGQGDVTPTHLKWKSEAARSDLSSPVIVGGHVYRLSGHNLVCMKLATGEEVYSKPLPGASGWASPILTPEGRIYCATAGKTYVLQAGPKGEVLATSDLGDPNHASPAVSDGRIYLRGMRFLYCIGAK